MRMDILRKLLRNNIFRKYYSSNRVGCHKYMQGGASNIAAGIFCFQFINVLRLKAIIRINRMIVYKITACNILD